MELKARIESDLAELKFEVTSPKKELLKILLSEIRLKKGNNPTNEEVLSIIKKFVENAHLCNNLEEANLLKEYLPEMKTEDEMRIDIETVIKANNCEKLSDLGKVMQILKLYPGMDMKFASNYAKNFLNSQ